MELLNHLSQESMVMVNVVQLGLLAGRRKSHFLPIFFEK